MPLKWWVHLSLLLPFQECNVIIRFRRVFGKTHHIVAMTRRNLEKSRLAPKLIASSGRFSPPIACAKKRERAVGHSLLHDSQYGKSSVLEDECAVKWLQRLLLPVTCKMGYGRHGKTLNDCFHISGHTRNSERHKELFRCVQFNFFQARFSHLRDFCPE